MISSSVDYGAKIQKYFFLYCGYEFCYDTFFLDCLTKKLSKILINIIKYNNISMLDIDRHRSTSNV